MTFWFLLGCKIKPMCPHSLGTQLSNISSSPTCSFLMRSCQAFGKTVIWEDHTYALPPYLPWVSQATFSVSLFSPRPPPPSPIHKREYNASPVTLFSSFVCTSLIYKASWSWKPWFSPYISCSLLLSYNDNTSHMYSTFQKASTYITSLDPPNKTMRSAHQILLPLFSDKETKTQRGYVTCQKSQLVTDKDRTRIWVLTEKPRTLYIFALIS